MLARLNQPGKQRSTAYSFPAPILGMNAVRSIAYMDPSECVFCYNILPSEFGMRVRQGFVEWANGWDGGAAKTVISYEGLSNDLDKLFVASPEGVFDVTTMGETAPTQVVTFPSSGNEAGICSYVQYINDGGDSFLLLCDGENGYYIYDRDANTWTKIAEGTDPGEIDGVDPDLFDYVLVWKNRVWFIERDSTRAWYLDPGQTTGAVEEFNFGTQFRSGGNLRQLVNWTVDGGEGIDDYLVAISGAGDVVLYEGFDPTDLSTFQGKGTWFIGEVPAGRRNATTFGGEVYILSVFGLLPLSQLLQGARFADPTIYATYKIAPYLRAIMNDFLREFGWHIHIHPNQGLLFVNTPDREVLSEQSVAFAEYFAHNAWGVVRGLNKNHSANWQGEVYWCDSRTNKIYMAAGFADGVYLDPETEGDAEPIDWDVLTSYQYLDAPTFKRVHYVRPIFIANGTPSYITDIRYDFEIDQSDVFPVLSGSGAALWDAAIWDIATWGGTEGPFTAPKGGNGIGRAVAVNIKGRSSNQTTLSSFEMVYEQGGIM